jgi:transposase-like protein
VQIIREIEAGKSVAQATREHQVHPPPIRQWQQQHAHYAEQAFQGNGRTYTDEARIAELEQVVGPLTLENRLLKKALLRLEAQEGSVNAPRSGRGAP